MEMCQLNGLAVQNIAKDIAHIKKSISKNDDTYDKEYSHLCVLVSKCV